MRLGVSLAIQGRWRAGELGRADFPVRRCYSAVIYVPRY